MKDLHSFLESLEKQYPEELVKVSQLINPEFEITTVLWKLEEMGLYPAVLFENVKNLRGESSGISVVSNVFASRDKVAWALDLPREKSKMDLTLEYHKRRGNLLKPKVIDRKDAPVKANVRRKGEVDLRELPVVTHHEMDSGPYFTMPVVAKDPDIGSPNPPLPPQGGGGT